MVHMTAGSANDAMLDTFTCANQQGNTSHPILPSPKGKNHNQAASKSNLVLSIERHKVSKRS